MQFKIRIEVARDKSICGVSLRRALPQKKGIAPRAAQAYGCIRDGGEYPTDCRIFLRSTINILNGESRILRFFDRPIRKGRSVCLYYHSKNAICLLSFPPELLRCDVFRSHSRASALLSFLRKRSARRICRARCEESRKASYQKASAFLRTSDVFERIKNEKDYL